MLEQSRRRPDHLLTARSRWGRQDQRRQRRVLRWRRPCRRGHQQYRCRSNLHRRLPRAHHRNQRRRSSAGRGQRRRHLSPKRLQQQSRPAPKQRRLLSRPPRMSPPPPFPAIARAAARQRAVKLEKGRGNQRRRGTPKPGWRRAKWTRRRVRATQRGRDPRSARGREQVSGKVGKEAGGEVMTTEN